jgi:hypothetical protein
MHIHSDVNAHGLDLEQPATLPHLSNETMVARRSVLKPSYAILRWLSESPREGPWTTLLLIPGLLKARTSDLCGELDEILTQFQTSSPLVSDKADLNPLRQIGENHATTQSQSAGDRSQESGTVVRFKERNTNTTRESSKAVLQTELPGVPYASPEKPLCNFNAASLTVAAIAGVAIGTALSRLAQISSLSPESCTCVSKGDGSSNEALARARSPSLVDDSLVADNQVVSSPCTDRLKRTVVNVEAEDADDAFWCDLSSLCSSECFGKDPSRQPSSPCTHLGVSHNPNDLHFHENAFYAILAAHGVRVNTRGDTDGNTGKQSLDEVQASGSSKKRSPSAAGEDATGKMDAQSDSDDGSRRPTKVQKKLRLAEDTTGPRWACPFYKFNDTVYATCSTWSTKRIETVKRHVLGRKHDSSPDMNPIKALRVRSLGVFRHDEDRWRAIYSKLFDVSRELLHSVPSPYWSATIVVVTDVAAVTAPSPLPTSWMTAPSSEIQPVGPLNLDARAYVNEATRLTELAEVQRGILRLRATQLQNQIDQARLQLYSTELEQQRIDTELMEDLGSLHARYVQGQPPEPEQNDAVSLHTEVQALIYATAQGPAPFEATIRRTLGDEAPTWSFAEVTASQAAEPSVEGDSGYGTMSNDTSCTCHDLWCFKCNKFGSGADSIFEGN